MPKGRIFAPATESDGLWFRHRGLPEIGSLKRESHTSTGQMLTAPFNGFTACYPPQPPGLYKDKDTVNFKTSNSFSAHDNRHSFQDHGVYFGGDGEKERSLGKRLTAPVQRQHFTGKDYLRHEGRIITNYDYNSIYGYDFLGNPTPHPPTMRRFPRHHKEGDHTRAQLETTTTGAYREKDLLFRTPLHVLAISQEPFLPDNKWKYSYHGLPKCYPQYNTSNSHNPFYAQWTQKPNEVCVPSQEE